MIFSRGKAKPIDYTSELRQVEADTIRRWRNIAAGVEIEDEPVQAVFSLGTDSSFDHRQACSDPTITLMDEIVLPGTGSDYPEEMQTSWIASIEPADSPENEEEPAFVRQSASYRLSDRSTITQQAPEPLTAELRSAIEIRNTATGYGRMAEAYEAAEVRTAPEESVTRLNKVPPSDLSISADEDIKRRFGNNIRSALGPGTVIEGTFSFDAPVCIDGTLNGEVRSSSALIVGAHANVTATVIVGSLIVLGKVTGPIQAEDLIEIRAGGELEGNIATKRLVVEDGGYFNGRCHHTE